MTIRTLEPHEHAALAAFAKEHGRRWKSQLTDVYWYNARPAGISPDIDSTLHALRNDPRWNWRGLDAYRLPKVEG